MYVESPASSSGSARAAAATPPAAGRQLKPMMGFHKRRSVAVALAVLLAAAGVYGKAHAQPAAAEAAADEPLKISLTLQRVSWDAQGIEVLSAADTVKPGDLLEYRAVYANGTERRLSGVLATLPVPEGMVYQVQTAEPSPTLAATGDGEFRPEPLTRTVTGPDGREITVAVPHDEYRALRWQLGSLTPGQSRAVAARVRVVATTESAVRSGDGS